MCNERFDCHYALAVVMPTFTQNPFKIRPSAHPSSAHHRMLIFRANSKAADKLMVDSLIQASMVVTGSDSSRTSGDDAAGALNGHATFALAVLQWRCPLKEIHSRVVRTMYKERRKKGPREEEEGEEEEAREGGRPNSKLRCHPRRDRNQMRQIRIRIYDHRRRLRRRLEEGP